VRGQSHRLFILAFAKAQTAAEKKGLACSPGDFAIGQASNLMTRLNGISDEVDAITPPNASVQSAWLGAAGAACSAGLRAEAANAKKPSQAKLDQARAKAHDKLVTTAGKAVSKAEQKGVMFDPEPDPSGFADSVDQLIDETAAALGPI